MVIENLEPNDKKVSPKKGIDEEGKLIHLWQYYLKKPKKTYWK